MPPRYNIAPTQSVAAIRAAESGDRDISMLHWGLIPFWAKDPAIGNRMINARSETVREKPAFRAAFKRRRCILPATGFYEWQKTDEGKIPTYIFPKKDDLFALAGLWECWQSPEGDEVESCTILTTSPNALMKRIHDRMPVILAPDAFDAWLDPKNDDGDEVSRMLKAFPARSMKTRAVSTFVNSPRNDSPRCVEAVEGTDSLF